MQTDSAAVFITGATGFIGQRLTRTLQATGHLVRALVRPEHYPDERVPAVCEQVAADLTDADSMAEAIAGSTAVVYCAGSVRGRGPVDFLTANIVGIQVMLDALERLPETPPLLLISSLAACRPELSDYARSKHAGEKLLLSRRSVPWSILRPPAVYGPGDREMLSLLKMARRGLLAHAGPADQRLSLLHVDDLINAIIAWLSASHSCLHKTYAIDDGRPGGYDWAAIGDVISGGKCHTLVVPRPLLAITARINLLTSYLLRYQPMITPGKVKELIQQDWLCSDNIEYTAATGWQPEMDLHAGIVQLFDSVS